MQSWKIWSYAMFEESLIQKARGLPRGRDSQLFMQTLLSNCTHTDITPGFKTDHPMIIINLSVHSNPKGNGFWMLNMSLLADTTSIEKIKVPSNTKNVNNLPSRWA